MPTEDAEENEIDKIDRNCRVYIKNREKLEFSKM